MGNKINLSEIPATVNFEAVAVVNRIRINTEPLRYTNLKCGECDEWWIMLCLGKKEKVICPWCGTPNKVLHDE